MLRRSAKARARQLTARAARLLPTDRVGAERAYRDAVELDPTLKEAWFDLGLICKWERRWDEAFECNLRAAELEGPKADEPAWWNLGIAATALRRWDVARMAWRTYGVPLREGFGPIEDDFDVAPVRLNPTGDAEVVWGQRIDPARVRIRSIPFPRSGHRWGDVVLHDGAPAGYREVNGQQRAVFDELERWEASDVPTLEVSIDASDSDVDGLITAVQAAGFAAEDWTRNVRVLCKRCSEGVVHAEHDPTALAAGDIHHIGIAGPRDLVNGLVVEWANLPGRVCHGIDETG
jgi:hypothetical protein